MKQFRYLWRELVQESTIRTAWKKLRKHKTKRKDVQYIDAHLDEEVAHMQLMLESTRPGSHCPEFGFWPIKHLPKRINERGKERIIYVPDIIEQWVHHCIIQVLAPIIMATASPNTCGSIPKRGMHYGKRKIEKWLRLKFKAKYFMKCDIRHFFDSVRRDIVMDFLETRIKDDWFLFVIERCLIHFPKGLPLGFYLSHWLANYILEPLDYILMRTSKTNVRYVDDIVVFGPNKRRLRLLIEKISIWLGRVLRLKLKTNWCVTRFDYHNKYRTLDFMGFVFHRSFTTIRKSILFAATKCAYNVHKHLINGRKVYIKIVRRLVSYTGWFSNTNTYTTFIHWIERYASKVFLNKIVSVYDKKRLEGA